MHLALLSFFLTYHTSFWILLCSCSTFNISLNEDFWVNPFYLTLKIHLSFKIKAKLNWLICVLFFPDLKKIPCYLRASNIIDEEFAVSLLNCGFLNILRFSVICSFTRMLRLRFIPIYVELGIH